MVRSDAVDSGCWSSVDSAGLLVPLDTHMMKVARAFGATGRKSADQKTVFEVTEWFARLNPADPEKYDFCILRPFLYEDNSAEQF
jgi:uncharacterized protein (TIGR02757 family)